MQKPITLEEGVSKGEGCVSPVSDSEAFALSCIHADSFPAAFLWTVSLTIGTWKQNDISLVTSRKLWDKEMAGRPLYMKSPWNQ